MLPELVEQQREQAIRQNLAQYIGGGRTWTAEELELLGTADDQIIVQRIGRTLNAVQSKRYRLRVPRAEER